LSTLKIFGPKRDKVTNERKILHENASPDIIGVIKLRRLKWARHVACAYRGLVEKPEERRPLGRPRRRRDGNIKMDLRKGGWEDLNWIDLA
jgi:hypothetical protein